MITRKTINKIYANAKQGNIKLQKWIANELYWLADVLEQRPNDRTFGDGIILVQNLMIDFENNDFEEAQKDIAQFEKDTLKFRSEKDIAKLNRAFV